MNQYLSRQEKENLIRLIVLVDELKTVIDNYAKAKSIDKKFLSGLRQSKTRSLRAVEKRMSFLSSEAITDLAWSAKKIRVQFMPHAEAIKADAELKKLRSSVVMNVDDFHDWYSWLIDYTCLTCNRPNYTECEGRKILMKYNIFPVNPAAVGICQYSYASPGDGVGDVGEALLNAMSN